MLVLEHADRSEKESLPHRKDQHRVQVRNKNGVVAVTNLIVELVARVVIPSARCSISIVKQAALISKAREEGVTCELITDIKATQKDAKETNLVTVGTEVDVDDLTTKGVEEAENVAVEVALHM